MFQNKKQVALARLDKAINENLVDMDIMPLVDTINNHPFFYTTSSCLGRIVVAESPENDRKQEYVWLGKWHRKVSFDEVKTAILQHTKNTLWFRMDPLILHVCCNTIDDSDQLLKCAKKAGLKRSGVVQIKPRIMAEIMGVDVVCAPVFRNVDDKLIEKFVDVANTRFDKNIKKLETFKKEIELLNE
ncbi:MAG: hypothetical protein KAI53_02155 [Candidatus Aenigmarchaeota archaeon]|nr:hypothetical protein [Candidatus Aenigmarchaeota archaeon]